MPKIEIEVDGTGRISASKREFILKYLLEKGPEGAYVKELYNGWVQFTLRLNKKSGNYKDFRTAVWKLRKEGLIEPFRTESVPNRWLRVYYRLS